MDIIVFVSMHNQFKLVPANMGMWAAEMQAQTAQTRTSNTWVQIV